MGSKSLGPEGCAQIGGEDALHGVEQQDSVMIQQEGGLQGLRASSELPEAGSEATKCDQDER